MENLTCPSCQSATPAEYNFCVACNSQTRCLNKECGKTLVPGKTFCFGCGQALAGVSTSQARVNKFVHTVTQGKSFTQHTEFHASDDAVIALAPFIAGKMTAPPPRRTIDVTGVSTGITTPKALPNSPGQRGSDDMQGQTQEQQEADLKGTGHPLESTGAARYFVVDGENLVPNTKDYKGKTWAEQQRNFILAYAAAYNQVFRKPVLTDLIKSVANKAGIADLNNFSKYLGKIISKYFTKLDQGVQLNADGIIEADRVVQSLSDSRVEAGYDYTARPPASAAKRQRVNADDKTKLQEWTKEEVNLGKLDITSIKTARDYALLAFWIITIHLKKAGAVRWNDAYYFLKEKYSTVSASAEAFSAAVRGNSNKKLFRQTDEGKIFLELDGQKKVNGWIEGQTKPSSENEDQ